MIKSMTGFGRCEVQKENRKFTVELKSVNHRYLDVNIRMPKKLNFFETSIRTLLKSYANRGKVDIFITYEDASQSQVSVRYHAGIAGEYLKYLQQMETEFGLENDIRVSTLARFPEVFTMEEQAEDEEDVSAHTGDDLVYKVAYGEAGYRDADDADEHEHERHGVVLHKAQNSLTERDGLFAYVFIFHFEPSVFLVRA